MGAPSSAAAAAILLLICIYLVHVSEGASPGRKLKFGKQLSEEGTGTDVDVANPDVMGYWNKKLGNIAVPGTIPTLVSRLSSAQVDRYLPLITSRDLLNATHDADAAAFCRAAGLICSAPAGPVDPATGARDDDSVQRSDPDPTPFNWWWNKDDDSIQRSDPDPTPFNWWWNKDADSIQRSDPDPTPFNWWWNKDDASIERKKETPPAFSKTMLARARQVYFLEADMPVAGSTVPGVLFSDTNGTLAGAYLPRKLATALRGLGWESLLRALRVPPTSSWAAAVSDTRARCDEYVGGVGTEQRLCAESLEDVADFVSDHLPAGAAVGANMSGAVLGSGEAFFAVVKVEKRSSASRPNVLCHTLGSFPYDLQACHSIEETELHLVTLQSVVDPTVSVSNVVACHTNTATFRPEHIAFQVLGKKPGEAGVCHWTRPGTTGFFVIG